MASGYGLIGNQIASTPTKHTAYSVGKSNKYGQSYSSLVDANPYANVDYRRSWWQDVLTGLGFRTNYDSYMESMALQAKEYDAAIAEKAYNENYDSALSQVQRERAAGINPDIAGDVSAGDSSALRDDGNPPVPPGSDYDTFSNFGSLILSGLQMAQGLAESGIGFMGSIADLRGKKISNDERHLSLALDALLSVTSPEEMNNFMNSSGDVVAVNYLPSLTQVFGSRRAKKYVRAVNRVASGLTAHGKEANMRNIFAGDWIDYHNKTAGGDDAGYSMFADTMKILRQGLSKDFWKNLRENTKLENMKIQDQTQYEQMRLGNDLEADTIAGAQAVNEGRKLGYEAEGSYQDWMLKQQQFTMSQSTASIVKSLNDAADSGNWFAGLVAMAIQFLFSRFSVGFSHRF